MSWTNFPPSSGDDIQGWDWLKQLWLACHERQLAVDDSNWPRTSTVYDSGTISSITSTSMTDGTKTWASSRWFDWTSGADTDSVYYDVILDADNSDPRKQIHASITGSTSTVLSIGDLTDFVTQGIIASVGSLGGTQYAIIKQGGLWWNERILPWPNEWEQDKGTVGRGEYAGIVDSRSTSTDGEVQVITISGSPAGGNCTLNLQGQTTSPIAYNAPANSGAGNVKGILEALSNVGSGNVSVTGSAGGPWTAHFSSLLSDLPKMTIESNALTGGSSPSIAISVSQDGPQNGPQWSINQWAGKEVLVRGDDGFVHRMTIISNTSNTVVYTTQSWKPSGAYIIVNPGARAEIGRLSGAPFWWNGGANKTYWTHHPADNLWTTNVPAASVSWSEGDGIICEDVSHKALDQDLWSQSDEECSEPDKSYSPDVYKTLRGIQAWIEGISIRFVEAKDYDGAMSIPHFTPATVFNSIGINSQTATATVSSGSATFSITVPGTIAVYYTVLDPKGNVFTQGTPYDDSPVYTSGSMTFTGLDEFDGKSVTLVVSLGWTRDYPREFRYMYPRTMFIPNSDPGAGDLFDPPEDVDGTGWGIGYWVTRPASTSYAEPDELGFVQETGTAFSNGDLVRHTGDNWNDPTPEQSLGATPFAVTDDQPDGRPIDLYYWDRFYTGRHPKTAQAMIDAQKSGIATGGAKHYLADIAQNWWSDWYGGGTLITHSGTATGGNTTTLSDTTKAADVFWVNALASSRWAGFILEVTKSGTTYYVPITSISGTTITFTAVTGLTVAASDAYQIREPSYELNRWIGRTLTITPAGGSPFNVTITHSDDKRLYFAAQATAIAAGAAYKITDTPCGWVWLRSSGQWVKPTGTDARGPATFRDNQANNLPTIVRSYGRIKKGDYISRNLLTEIWKFINALRWTTEDYGWQAKGEENVVATLGGFFPGADFGPASPDHSGSPWTYDEAWGDLMGRYTDGWSGPEGEYSGHYFGPDDDIAPFAELTSYSQSGAESQTPDDYGHIQEPGYSSTFAYAKISGLPHRMSSAIDFYAFATINSIDVDEGLVKNWDCSPPHGTDSIVCGHVENSFIANGTPLQYRKWAKVDSLDASNAVDRDGVSKIGTAPDHVPDWKKPADPLPYQHACLNTTFPNGYDDDQALSTVTGGYFIKDKIAILKWDVDGGMTYVD